MKQVAITIDDLPIHGETGNALSHFDIASRFIKTFQKNQVPPVYGFTNGCLLERNPSYDQILRLWVDHGNFLGNHTYSHPDIRKLTPETFISDIKKNENILSKYSEKKDYKFFRYPYLREGETQEKHDAVKAFLKKENYVIAPVTIDFGDYLWNEKVASSFQKKSNLSHLKKEYLEASVRALDVSLMASKLLLNRDIKHILLLHLGIATSLFLEDLLKVYLQKGCQFISLQSALEDPIYKTLPNIPTKSGLTLLGRLMEQKNIKS